MSDLDAITDACTEILASVRRIRTEDRVGRADERAAVVAWLRAEAPTRRSEVWGLISGLADDIERGAHEVAS